MAKPLITKTTAQVLHHFLQNSWQSTNPKQDCLVNKEKTLIYHSKVERDVKTSCQLKSKALQVISFPKWEMPWMSSEIIKKPWLILKLPWQVAGVWGKLMGASPSS